MEYKTLDDIKGIIKAELTEANKLYDSQLKSDVTLLANINDYVGRRKGKELRMMLVLLSACLKSGGVVDQKTIAFAAAMELLHNASLIHDDIVDNADNRRGQKSVREMWGNQVAVLCGDYYLAKVMHLLLSTNDSKAIESVCTTVSEMSEGELLQQQYMNDNQAGEEIYYDIVRRKTASLMATSCQLGWDTMRYFGMHYGMAFQIADDINDQDEDSFISKPCTDKLIAAKNSHIAEALKTLDVCPESKYKDAIRGLVSLLN